MVHIPIEVSRVRRRKRRAPQQKTSFCGEVFGFLKKNAHGTVTCGDQGRHLRRGLRLFFRGRYFTQLPLSCMTEEKNWPCSSTAVSCSSIGGMILPCTTAFGLLAKPGRQASQQNDDIYMAVFSIWFGDEDVVWPKTTGQRG